MREGIKRKSTMIAMLHVHRLRKLFLTSLTPEKFFENCAFKDVPVPPFFCRLKCNQKVAYCAHEMEAVFKALADESRRKLLDQLYQDNGLTLGELCAHLDMTRQAVTKHLRLLEAANLIAVVWRGREKLHYLNPVPIHEISERWIGKYERHRLQALGDLKKGLEQNKKVRMTS
jgi:DNA-binding transcriptional ArsR family regulator